jgi:hypothetical protein
MLLKNLTKIGRLKKTGIENTATDERKTGYNMGLAKVGL